MPKQEATKPTPPTILTLTLPRQEGVQRSGTLLVQRGELAHVRQFVYASLSDFPAVIKDAVVALAQIEANPPQVTAPSSHSEIGGLRTSEKAKDAELLIEVPVKTGSRAVKGSCLKIAGGETDEAVYRRGLVIAGRLIDGKLWDGDSAIRIEDIDAAERKLKHLTDAELSLFELRDFVLLGEGKSSDAVDGQDAPGEIEKSAVDAGVASSSEPNQLELM